MATKTVPQRVPPTYTAEQYRMILGSVASRCYALADVIVTAQESLDKKQLLATLLGAAYHLAKDAAAITDDASGEFIEGRECALFGPSFDAAGEVAL